MRTYVVSGGTAGMGRGLARHFLRRGDQVTIIGSDPAKGRRFLDQAARAGAGDRTAFVQADLTSVAENVRVIKEITARHESLDGLVLTAMRHFPRRVETPDGFEATFALYYVSRMVLGYGLTGLLEKGENPMIVSVCGVGATKGRIHWDDLSLRNGFGHIKAVLQAGRATDLLGVAYSAGHPDGRTRFLLHHPGFTDSGADSLGGPAKAVVKVLARFFAQPIEKSIQPIIELMDDAPGRGLLAYDRRTPIDPSLPTLDPGDARRLYERTAHVLRP
ncbi:SDR family NAD(P)-dependent oxidoreductase [Nonomuraea sp. KC401]|uniref:SDR family NAD(P)-dependent oxidoreductase n=1 Tax=unclassified Nonomuraea TaxID=2593643 RepID=UPI0010FE0E7F|nr:MULTISPECIES: SDR family NAD(P)-dependent oxidoreductase [unclassified Nonomuraea]NBE93548.1 SDR family NAD(P)-dependent oxidoreductase [Nonomuraea sp. K271]TLF79964.1 SDR family NAD(P)-dependent oxidoreductase [Nonomuraea sp. KC401]